MTIDETVERLRARLNAAMYCEPKVDAQRTDALLSETMFLADQLRELVDAAKQACASPGYPKCDRHCSSRGGGPTNDLRCDCGMEEMRVDAKRLRAALKKVGES